MERLEQPITMTVDYLDSEAPGNKPPPSNKAVPLETSSVPEAAGGDYIAFPEEEKLHSLCNVLTVTSDQNTKTLVQACYISLFAIFGVLLRMIIAQLFGEECANPGTVGWLAASSPLCVTADGSATQSGGIVFADLPSNILGSFLMGIFQDGAVLNLAVPLTIAWVAPNHPFQSMAVLHKAFTTGFCGSLTTFSSWNAEMVVMLYGTDTTRTSQLVSAMLGYIIGMETALGSFVCGKSVARRLHTWVNPILAAEATAARQRCKEGVFIDKELPDFERRFLADLVLVETSDQLLPLGRVDALERWRTTTAPARRVGHPLLPTLIEIEHAVFLVHRPIPPDLVSIGQAEGWDLDALLQWIHAKAKDIDFLPSLGSRSMANISMPAESIWFTLPVAALLLLGVMIFLVVNLLVLEGGTATEVTYRTMIYAMTLAPAGALLRWKLSSWNGKLNVEGWEWLPLGTLTANVVGSMVSIAAVAGEYRIGPNSHYTQSFWPVGTIRAVKVGFSGSLTTVSTFVAEINGFMQNETEHAYPYIIATLSMCSALSAVVYGCIVFYP